jgi:hypothetical protein
VLSTPLPGIDPKSQPKGDWVMLLIRKAWYGLVAGKRLAERRWVAADPYGRSGCCEI